MSDAPSQVDAKFDRSSIISAYRIGGISIREVGKGSAPALLFVHGFCCSGSDWEEQMLSLSDRFRCVALDLPGHGESDEADGPNMAALGAAVNLVKSHIGTDVVLLGHSLGCKVVREAYRQDEARVVGTVMIDGSLYVGRKQAVRKAAFEAVAGDAFPTFLGALVEQMFSERTDETAAQRIRDRAKRMNPSFARALFLDSVEWDIEHAVQTIRELGVPTSVIQCMSFDTSFGWRSMQPGEETPFMTVMRTLAADAHVSVLPNSGHFPMLDAPAALKTKLSSFLAILGDRAR